MLAEGAVAGKAQGRAQPDSSSDISVVAVNSRPTKQVDDGARNGNHATPATKATAAGLERSGGVIAYRTVNEVS